MAYNHISALFLIALILFATANPLAHATFIDLRVLGRLCCSPTGNCQGGAVGIPGVVVGLNCTSILGVSVRVGQNTTNVQGLFNITVLNLPSVLRPLPPPLNGTILPCFATVNLPLNQTLCPVLSTVNGTLVGVTQLVNSTLVGLIRRVLTANVVGFVGVGI